MDSRKIKTTTMNFKRKIKGMLALVFIFSLFPVYADAHPGNTDSNGGHYCRTNCENWGLEYGEYHYHPSPKENQMDRESRINELESQVSELESRNSDLEWQISNSGLKMSDFESLIAGIESQISGLWAAIIRPDGFNTKDSEGDGSNQDSIVQTINFEVDTDHDGILDSNDSNPLNPGILTSSDQKLKGFDYLLEDIMIPNGSIKKDSLDIDYVGEAYANNNYYNYEINKSFSQVIDFFLEKMVNSGWRTNRLADNLDLNISEVRGMILYYSKDYETIAIVIIGQEIGQHTQFTIIHNYAI